jgi:ABC-type polysaccharide/polyol phosphate export permease
MALVRNDLRSRYRRSIIGIGWSLLQPIAMTVVLCIVFCQLFGQSLREFAPNLLSGLTFWGFMTAVVTEGCQCFFRGESYIRQHPAPLAIYPLRTTLGAGFHFLLGFGIALAIVWTLQGFGNLPALVCLVPIFALLFVVGWSLAVCVGLMNVMFQDSQHLIDIVMQMLFYVMPIIYTPKMLILRLQQLSLNLGWDLNWMINLNPFAVLLALMRAPLLEGQCPSLALSLLGSLIGCLAVGIAALALRQFEKRLIFYL